MRTFSRALATDAEKESRRRGKQKKKAMSREKKLAKSVGGQRQPGSGAGWHKGDVKGREILYDDKFTNQLGFRLTQQAIAKLCDEAQGEGNRVPATGEKRGARPDGLTRRLWVLLDQNGISSSVSNPPSASSVPVDS